jgi:uncharacterized surface protein with fasciclin (FAS1) repeats
MKKNVLKLSLVMVMVTLMNVNCSSPAAGLMSTLSKTPELSSFAGLLKGAGGAGNLSKLVGKDPFTMLIPSNDALKNIPADAIQNLMKPENSGQLESLLKKHMLPGKVNASDIANGGLKDAAGNAMNLNGAKISKSVPTKNGLIQIIDKVL